MAIIGTGTLDNSVSAAFPLGWSSSFSYDYFSGGLSLQTTYVDTLEIGRRVKEIVITNGSSQDVQFRMREHFGTTKDGGIVLKNSTLILRHSNRDSLQLRCDAGSVSGVYVMGF